MLQPESLSSVDVFNVCLRACEFKLKCVTSQLVMMDVTEEARVTQSYIKCI